MCQIFEFSAKKQGLLERHIKEEISGSGNLEKRTKLLNVCRTRWLMRLDGLERIQQMFKPIIKTLEDIKNNHDGSYKADARADANGVYTMFLSFGFVINLVVVRNILGYIGPLTAELQKVKIDILGVYDAVDNAMDTLVSVRANVDEKHTTWYKEAESFAQEIDIPITKPRYTGVQKNRANYDTTSVSDYYKFSLTIPLLDMIICEFRARFSKDHRIHGSGFLIVPSKVLTAEKWKEYVISFANQYADDLPNLLRLDTELDLWENLWKRELRAKNDIPDNITDTIAYLHEKDRHIWYPNIYTILVLIGVVPGSSCSCERCISRLRLLETYLRSTMSQDRLNGLALLYTHSNLKIDYEILINIFARNFRHRLELIDILNEDDEPDRDVEKIDDDLLYLLN